MSQAADVIMPVGAFMLLSLMMDVFPVPVKELTIWNTSHREQ